MEGAGENLEQISYIRNVIRSNGEKIKFNIGQSICEKAYLPGNIYLIESGVARLIDRIEDKLTTVKKFNKGSIVGLSSILRGISCEDVRASTEIIAWRIDDLVLENIYNADKRFYEACNQFLGHAERIELSQKIYNNTFNIEINKNKLIDALTKHSFLFDEINNHDIDHLLENHFIFLGSKLESKDIGTLITSKSEFENLLNEKLTFKIRIICILKSILN